jgi:hypothetical protein
MIQLHCAIHSVRFDKDGEATVTLKVPLSDRAAVLQLTEKTEQVLWMTIDSQTATVES